MAGKQTGEVEEDLLLLVTLGGEEQLQEQEKYMKKALRVSSNKCQSAYLHN